MLGNKEKWNNFSNPLILSSCLWTVSFSMTFPWHCCPPPPLYPNDLLASLPVPPLLPGISNDMTVLNYFLQHFYFQTSPEIFFPLRNLFSLGGKNVFGKMQQMISSLTYASLYASSGLLYQDGCSVESVSRGSFMTLNLIITFLKDADQIGSKFLVIGRIDLSRLWAILQSM